MKGTLEPELASLVHLNVSKPCFFSRFGDFLVWKFCCHGYALQQYKALQKKKMVFPLTAIPRFSRAHFWAMLPARRRGDHLHPHTTHLDGELPLQGWPKQVAEARSPPTLAENGNRSPKQAWFPRAGNAAFARSFGRGVVRPSVRPSVRQSTKRGLKGAQEVQKLKAMVAIRQETIREEQVNDSVDPLSSA